MLEKTYHDMNTQITPSAALLAETLARLGAGQRSLRPRRHRPLLAAAALLLCFVLATPVLAVQVPAIKELMYLASPALAQYFTPVQESCENNGVCMEVVSVSLSRDTVKVYLTLEDLEGDRVDATTDLFDSYSLQSPFDSTNRCEQVGFDETSGKATFLVTISTMDGSDITGGKASFSVGKFLSRKTRLEKAPSALDLSTVREAVATQEVYASGFGGWEGENYRNASNSYTVLQPGEALETPLAGLAITAIGYVDGRLHVQYSTTEKLRFDPHGFVELVDEYGGTVKADYSISFIEGADTDARVDYQEFIFDLPREEISGYTLRGSYYTSGLNTQGPWSVTFTLKDSGTGA